MALEDHEAEAHVVAVQGAEQRMSCLREQRTGLLAAEDACDVRIEQLRCEHGDSQVVQARAENNLALVVEQADEARAQREQVARSVGDMQARVALTEVSAPLVWYDFGANARNHLVHG